MRYVVLYHLLGIPVQPAERAGDGNESHVTIRSEEVGDIYGKSRFGIAGLLFLEEVQRKVISPFLLP
ncbi:MAG: hypothetical protein M0P57_08330 [Syntrophales bacterium]|jgi:hypothetical protein|nr:hypothetical protein [Syntrophales bacterium]MDY0043726.1 hypothetical protein [Syntrophales bacterium]